MTPQSKLADYPRPSFAVDVALLTVLPGATGTRLSEEPGHLAVLVQRRSSSPRGVVLVGQFVRPRQTLAEAVHEVLEVKAGVATDQAPHLLRIFDDPRRDERGWTMSAAHALALPYDEVSDARGTFVPISPTGRLATDERLLFDHQAMLTEAVSAMRRRYELRPDPYRLLGDRFTLSELRSVHEAVLGEPLLPDTFNRRMLERLAEASRDGATLTRPSGGRPARVYRRRSRRRPSPSEARRLQLPRA